MQTALGGRERWRQGDEDGKEQADWRTTIMRNGHVSEAGSGPLIRTQQATLPYGIFPFLEGFVLKFAGGNMRMRGRHKLVASILGPYQTRNPGSAFEEEIGSSFEMSATELL